MRAKSEKLWGEALSRYPKIAVYTADPGAHAIAKELVPLLERRAQLKGWFADGWSAAQAPDLRPGSGLFDAARADDTILLGSQTNFSRTQGIIKKAKVAGIGTIFVFDHWKNFSVHFGDGPLPDLIAVPDDFGKQMLLDDVARARQANVIVLPHLGIEASADRVLAYQAEPSENVALLLDPTERADGLGYDWRSTLAAAAGLAVNKRVKKIQVKPHPRQDTATVRGVLDRLDKSEAVFELFQGETEQLIASVSEVWGMTTVALVVALEAGKRIRSLQVGRNSSGRNASNPHIEPYVIDQLSDVTA